MSGQEPSGEMQPVIQTDRPEIQQTSQPETGLVGEWQRTEKAYWEVRSRLNKKAEQIFDDGARASARLKELGLLPIIPDKERPETKVLEGTLIGKDGRELRVSAGDYGVSFDDLTDPTRRGVQIRSGTIDLISESEGIYIDQFGKDPWRPGAVGRTDDGHRYREEIGKEEKYAGLRGDLERDVLDAAAEGLAFILDPGTTLKPA